MSDCQAGMGGGGSAWMTEGPVRTMGFARAARGVVRTTAELARRPKPPHMRLPRRSLSKVCLFPIPIRPRLF